MLKTTAENPIQVLETDTQTFLDHESLTSAAGGSATPRHSVRAEAQKAVNYSSKRHPQDQSIPGYNERRATERSTSSRGQKRRRMNRNREIED